MHSPLAFAVFTALLSTTAVAQNAPARATNDPHTHAEGSWIGITGKVESTDDEGFILNYGPGTIKVQVDENSTKQRKLLQDEQVRVYGVMDKSFFQGKTIRAHAIYLESAQEYVCVTEGAEARCTAFAPVIYSGVVVHGRVTKAENNMIEVDSGDDSMGVDISKLHVAGNAKAVVPVPKVGDLVTVLGVMDEGIFTRKLNASSLEIDRH